MALESVTKTIKNKVIFIKKMQHPTKTSTTVITCYDILDAALAGGIQDFTDGMYDGDPFSSYETAQKNQARWLLDKVKCKAGSKILDIGCGNGRILQAAQEMGAKSTGITISEPQARRNKQRGLDVQLMNYRDIPASWNGFYDGVIANGSIEHFVQVQDAIDGKQDDLYQELFEICHRIIRPGGYFATTIIHFNQPVNPLEIQKGSKRHQRGSDSFQLAKLLLEDFGGWYPVEGQLERCAEGYFTLEEHLDGTEDYRLTSEVWLSQIKEQIFTNPNVWGALIGKLFRHPFATVRMLDDLVFAQSWMWQFREREGRGTPTKLFRDVWKKIN